MSKLLISSDSHLGCRLYGEDFREQDYRDAFKEMIDIAIEENVDKVIHAGDLFHTPTPSSKNLSFCMKQLLRLKEKNIEFLSIVGNHERKLDEQWLDLYSEVDASRRLNTEPIEINNDIDIAIYGVDAINNSWWDSKEFNFKDVSADINIVVMHELFTPPVPEHKSDHPLSDVDDKIKNINTDILIVGDFHKKISNTYPKYGFDLFYPGPTERTAHNQGEPGVFIFEIDKKYENNYTYRRRKINNRREFLKEDINLDKYSSIDKIRRKAEQLVIDTNNNKKPILIANITGNSKIESLKELREELEGLDKFKYVRLQDNREEDSDISDIEIDSSVNNIEKNIEEEVKDLDVEDEIKDIDEFIRNYEGNETEFREKVSEKLKGDKNDN